MLDLRQLFDALLEERARTWAPADLKANADQRQTLVTDFRGRRLVTAGDFVPNARLLLADGAETDLDQVLRAGPVILIFFRFAGCPACNIALPHYAQTLFAEAQRRGATLLALSPQIPQRVVEIARRHSLPFPVATDPDNGLARHFNITFGPTPDQRAAAAAAGRSAIRDITGGRDDHLPSPAVVIIGQDHKVVFADVTPDWMRRTETAAILAALDSVRSAALAAD